jgi:hypothetical protein
MGVAFGRIANRSEFTIPARQEQLAARPRRTSSIRALAPRPPARDADGMAKPLTKLVALLTPKRRWAKFRLSLA